MSLDIISEFLLVVGCLLLFYSIFLMCPSHAALVAGAGVHQSLAYNSEKGFALCLPRFNGGMQIFEVLPLNIRVDYLPRRVDLAALRGGNYTELVNMVQWKVDPGIL